MPGVPDRSLKRPATVQDEQSGEQRPQRHAARKTAGKEIRPDEADETLPEHLEADGRPHVGEEVER